MEGNEKRCGKNWENEKPVTGEQYLSLTFHRRMIQAFSSAVVNVSFCANALSFKAACCGFGHLLKSVMATAPRDPGSVLMEVGVVSDMGLLTLSPNCCLLIGDNTSILTGTSSETAAVPLSEGQLLDRHKLKCLHCP